MTVENKKQAFTYELTGLFLCRSYLYVKRFYIPVLISIINIFFSNNSLLVLILTFPQYVWYLITTCLFIIVVALHCFWSYIKLFL